MISAELCTVTVASCLRFLHAAKELKWVHITGLFATEQSFAQLNYWFASYDVWVAGRSDIDIQ